MLMEVGQFCDRVELGLNTLVDELQQVTGRMGDWERNAWMRSLPKLSILLANAELDEFHVQFGEASGVSLEYRLPGSGSWCDAVLLGQGHDKPEAIMVELKDWQISSDESGPRPGLVTHKGTLYLHPSEQVKGYVEYCRRFHSTVLEREANVDGCVFFSSAKNASAYQEEPHDELVKKYPVFTSDTSDLDSIFPAYLRRRLKEPDFEFARDFEVGSYQQDRSFTKQVAKTIHDPSTPQFVLLDEQRKGYEHCLGHIEGALSSSGPEEDNKKVIIIEGPPGAGKSVLAAHIWAAMTRNDGLDGNVVLTTTSGCQRSNWEELFTTLAEESAGKGIVMPANQYNPGLHARWVGQKRKDGHEIEVETWRENLELFDELEDKNKAPDNAYDVSVVDEAHALIDPTLPGKRGIPPSGWSVHAGPQGWHVIRCSKVSIFLMDSDQSYRDNETTTPELIEQYAEDFGIDEVHRIGLGDAQFRCGGAKEYVDWVDHVLELSESSLQLQDWRIGTEGKNGKFLFEIADNPSELEANLRDHIDQDYTARITASYAREWKTKGIVDPHELPPEQKDFSIRYQDDGETKIWHKVWNYAPDQDYEWFIQAPEGSKMHEDMLSEVGCPYVMRGFDFDYIGLLWLDDLIRRDGQWQVNIGNVHESAWPKTVAAAKKENHRGEATKKLIERLLRGYRILMTRAIRGLHVWFQDGETEEYVKKQLPPRG